MYIDYVNKDTEDMSLTEMVNFLEVSREIEESRCKSIAQNCNSCYGVTSDIHNHRERTHIDGNSYVDADDCKISVIDDTVYITPYKTETYGLNNKKSVLMKFPVYIYRYGTYLIAHNENELREFLN